MKDAELISRLQEVLIPGNWGGSQEDQLRHVHQGIAAIIVALEANPPLAEVEDMVAEGCKYCGQHHFRFCAKLEGVEGDCPVTVTIRKGGA